MARKKYSEAREARRFGVILAILLLALASFSLWRGHIGRAGSVAAIAVLSVVLPFIAPKLWLEAFRLWMKLAEGLSWVMTRVILTTFFYLVLTPVGLFLRLIRNDLLDRRFRDGRPTYWKDKEPVEPTLERYAKRF
jgi:hypothetical protein